MTTVARPNFFLLLGLNPNEVWNQTLFEETLQQKRGEWSRQGAGVTKKALVAKQNLALLQQIGEVMLDSAQREMEASAARKELTSLRNVQLEQFARQLAFMNAKDAVEQEEVARFIDAFKHLLTPEEITSRISVKIHTAAPTHTKTASMLDVSIVKSVTDRLPLIHMNTLYELLQCSTKVTTPELLRAAEKFYMQAVRLPPTAEVTVKIELAGLARQVFKSEEHRASYDESIRQASLAQLLNELDASVSRSTEREVHQKQVLLFLENAKKEGWREHEALARLRAYARQRKWSMTTPAIHEGAENVSTQATRLVMAQGAGVLPLSQTVITYEIKLPTLFRKQRTLHIAADPPGDLPDLLLMSRQGRLPFGKNDGCLFYRLTGASLSKRSLVCDLPDTPLPSRTFAKLFLGDDSTYRLFMVHHPCEDRMRLN